MHFWGDTHGQSNETLGTNTAREYFEFGRDKAHVDVMGHQGNDFQITGAFWRELNALTKEFDKPGDIRLHPGLRMVGQHRRRRRPQRALPHAKARRSIRSSHAQIADATDIVDEASDAHTAHELFDRTQGQGLRRSRACRRPLCRHQICA